VAKRHADFSPIPSDSFALGRRVCNARDFLRANRRSNIHLYPNDWKKLPIPDVLPEKQKLVEQLVDRILAEKQQNPEADTSELECKIDQLVYSLYGLTPEEIKIVESATK